MPELSELRKRFGAGLSDEEFLLRATMPQEQVDAMVAAGPCSAHYNPIMSPVEKLIDELSKRPDVTHAKIERAGFKLELRTDSSNSSRSAV
jgi:oxaloacetate decarboxylase alpha subunit